MEMKTKKVELFIQAKKRNWEDKFSISVDTFEFKSDSHGVAITLDKKIIEIEVPELDEKALTLSHVEQIREQIKVEKAASYLRVARMEEHINSLMCLENNLQQADDVLSTLNTEVNE